MANVNRGSARWMRAAINAAKNPNSDAAKLYFRRVKNARTIADAPLINNSPMRFMELKFQWDPTTRATTALGLKFKYAACSVYCATLQMQLDFGVSTVEGIASVFEGGRGMTGRNDRVERLNTKTLSRNVKCIGCGREIKKTK